MAAAHFSVMPILINIIISISALFAISNCIIHLLLFKYTFNYPQSLASICFNVLLATWMISGIISLDYNKTNNIDFVTFLQKTWAFIIVTGMLGIYVLITWVFVLGIDQFHIDMLEIITPDRAKVVSSMNILFYCMPLWALYLPRKKGNSNRT